MSDQDTPQERDSASLSGEFVAIAARNREKAREKLVEALERLDSGYPRLAAAATTEALAPLRTAAALEYAALEYAARVARRTVARDA